jgi:hypothetical protein
MRAVPEIIKAPMAPKEPQISTPRKTQRRKYSVGPNRPDRKRQFARRSAAQQDFKQEAVTPNPTKQGQHGVQAIGDLQHRLVVHEGTKGDDQHIDDKGIQPPLQRRQPVINADMLGCLDGNVAHTLLTALFL